MTSHELDSCDAGNLLAQLLRDCHTHRHDTRGRTSDPDVDDGAVERVKGQRAAAGAHKVWSDLVQNLQHHRCRGNQDSVDGCSLYQLQAMMAGSSTLILWVMPPPNPTLGFVKQTEQLV